MFLEILGGSALLVATIWFLGSPNNKKENSPTKPIVNDDESNEWVDIGDPNLSGNEYAHDSIKRNIEAELMPFGMKKVWSTALDERVCVDCFRLEGMALDMDEPFVSGNHSVQIPPLHEGCRCAVMYLEPQELKKYSAIGQKISILKKALSIIKKSSDPIEMCEYHALAIELCENLSEWQEPPQTISELKFLKSIPKRFTDLKKNKIKYINSAIKKDFQFYSEWASQLKTAKGRINRMSDFYAPLVERTDFPDECLSYAKQLFDAYVAEQRNQKGIQKS